MPRGQGGLSRRRVLLGASAAAIGWGLTPAGVAVQRFDHAQGRHSG